MKDKLRKRILTICVCALLAALCFVLAYFAKMIFSTSPLRFTIENIPVFIASAAYGPVMGMLVGVMADLLSCVVSGMAPIPLITVGAALVGLVSGLVFRFVKIRPAARTFAGVFAGHAVGSMAVKTIALYGFYGGIVFVRIPIYIGIALLESITLILLFGRKSIRNLIKKAGGELYYDD